MLGPRQSVFHSIHRRLKTTLASRRPQHHHWEDSFDEVQAQHTTGPDMDAAPLLRNSSSIVREDSGRKLKRLEHFERADTATAILKKTKYQVGRSVQTYDEKERAGVQRAIDAEKRKSRYSVTREHILDNRMYVMDEDAISLAKQSIDKVVENERSRKVRLKLKQQEATAAVAAPIGEDTQESNSKPVSEEHDTVHTQPNSVDQKPIPLEVPIPDRLQDDLHTSPSRQAFQFRRANFPEKGTRGTTGPSSSPHPEPRRVASNAVVDRLHKLATDGRQLPLAILNAIDLPSLTASDLSRVLWCVVRTNSASWPGFGELLKLLTDEVSALTPKEVARTLLGMSQVRPLTTDILLTQLVGALLSRAALEDTVGLQEALTGSSACVALCAVSKLINGVSGRRPPSGWLDLHDTVESLAGRLVVGNGLSNKEICVALSGMATSGVLHRPSTAIMLDDLLSRVDTLQPTQLVGVLWSLSKLNVKLNGDIVKTKIRRALGDLAQLPPREVASLLHSTARCVKDKAVSRELRKELIQHIKPQQLNGNEISAVIEGLAATTSTEGLPLPNADIITSVLDRLSEIRLTLSPSQLVRCSIALHKLPKTSGVVEVTASLLQLCEERLYAFKPQQYVALLPTATLNGTMMDRSSKAVFTKARDNAPSLSVQDLLKLLAVCPDDSALLRAIDDKVTDDYRFPRPTGAVVATTYLKLLGRERGHLVRKQVPNLVRMSRSTEELHELLYAVGELSSSDTMDHLHTKYGVQALETAVERIGLEEDPVALLEALSYVHMDPNSTISAIITNIEANWSDIGLVDRERALAAMAELGVDSSNIPQHLASASTLHGMWSRLVRDAHTPASIVAVVLDKFKADVGCPVDGQRLQQLYLHVGMHCSSDATISTGTKYSRWISDALSYLGIPHQPDSPQLGGSYVVNAHVYSRLTINQVILAKLPTHGIGIVMDESTYPGGRPTGRGLVQRRQLLSHPEEGITRLVVVRRLELVRARQRKELVPFIARLLTGYITDSPLLEQYSNSLEITNDRAVIPPDSPLHADYSNAHVSDESF